MKNIKNEVFNKIEENREEAIEYLLKIISFKSINYQYNGDEKEAQEWMNEKLIKLGFKTEMFDVDPGILANYHYFVEPGDRNYKDRPNIAGKLKGNGGGKTLVLNGHMDVVPCGSLKNWTHSPWGELKDGKIYGRGSSDMKGGLIAMYMAVKALKDLNICLKGDIIFQSVVDEESTGNGTLMCIAKGYTGDGGIIGECTNLEIQTAHRGVQFLRVKTTGLSGHAAQRQKLVNANDKMILIYNSLMECERTERVIKKHPMLSSPTINVGMIHGGDAPHIVPDKCEINCDVKYLPSEKGKEVREIINKYIYNAIKKDQWLQQNPPEIDWLLDADPSELSKDHPIVISLKKAYINVIGKKPIFSGLQGCADMRHLIKRGNTPTILFGPGNIDSAHHVDEYVEINNIITASKIFAQLILDWCQTA